MGYRKRWGKVSVLCPGWAGSGEGKAAQLSHWRGGELGFIPAFCRALYPELLWEMQDGFCRGAGAQILLCFDCWWWRWAAERDPRVGKGKCQQGSRSSSCSSIFKQWLHWNAPGSAFGSSTCAREISWAVLPLPRCQPGDAALQSRTLHCFFCYLELSELWLQLIWQHCCHGNEDFIVHYPLLAQGEKSNFLWLLPPLERLVKQAPLYWVFVAASVKALGEKM